MSPASKSKSKDKKTGKDPLKGSSKSSVQVNSGGGLPASGYNPILGTFHTIETAPLSSATALHVNGRFRNIDDTDDPSGNSLGAGVEYDSLSNNDSWSGESEDQKDKSSHLPARQEMTVPGADNDKREKIRQKNERKHQRQKERRAQELHERCSGYLMSRKLEALAQQLVAMGFSHERATMALILNEGRVEESVAWLFEGGEEAVDKPKEHNVDGGSNLKIDIFDELARITDMELRYKCSKQDIERIIVSCEGDLEKAEETLRVQKQDPPAVPPKPEETGDPPIVGNSKIPVSACQNSRVQAKPTPQTMMLQKRDEKDFNYTKGAVVGSSMDAAKQSHQSVKRIQPKEWGTKTQQIGIPVEKKWSAAGSNPAASYSLASSLQASPPPSKTESRVGNDAKSLHLGSVREPVIVMQRPQSINVKPAPSASVNSSSPATTTGWYASNVETMKANGFVPVSSSRSLSPSNVNASQLYNKFPYRTSQPFVSSSGSMDVSGTTRGNGLWSKGSTSPTISAASSLGLFSGLGANGSSGSSSPVDWNTGSSMLQLDYTNIDWSLNRGNSISTSSAFWSGLVPRDGRQYDSFTSTLNVKPAMRPILPSGNNVHISGLQETVGSSDVSTGTSREWTSPFEEKDLFSLPRQFVSPPSL